jgi:hypothetical protein
VCDWANSKFDGYLPGMKFESPHVCDEPMCTPLVHHACQQAFEDRFEEFDYNKTTVCCTHSVCYQQYIESLKVVAVKVTTTETAAKPTEKIDVTTVALSMDVDTTGVSTLGETAAKPTEKVDVTAVALSMDVDTMGVSTLGEASATAAAATTAPIAMALLSMDVDTAEVSTLASGPVTTTTTATTTTAGTTVAVTGALLSMDVDTAGGSTFSVAPEAVTTTVAAAAAASMPYSIIVTIGFVLWVAL